MIDGKLVQRARPDSVVKALIQNGNDPGSGEPVFSEEGARKPALVECAKSGPIVKAEREPSGPERPPQPCSSLAILAIQDR
jgi:hypothetical protein